MIYVPEYWGIHGNITTNDNYADVELGKDITLINTYDVYTAEYSNYDSIAEFRYSEEADAGFYAMIDNPDADENDWYTTGDIIFISSYPMSYEISYYDNDAGKTVFVDIDAGRLSSYVIENTDTVYLDSIEIVRIG